MGTKEPVQLHECCVVPFRHTPSGIEFCLLTPTTENRWEFPKSEELADQSREDCLRQAASRAGLKGKIDREQPLGDFVASRAGQERSMVGHLMLVTGVDVSWPQQSDVRRLWCLAEEARVRIRRKPLRRFIDLALHAIETSAAAAANVAERSLAAAGN